MMKVEKILFPVEFTGASEKALARVERIAGIFGAEVIFLHVISETPVFLLASPNTEKYIEFIRQRAMEKLNDYVSQFESKGIKARAEITDGKIYLKILEAARDLKADLIIMTRKGEYGSTVLKVVRKSDVPVYIVKEEEPSPIRSILFPTDLSGPAGFGWRYAVEIAKYLDARLIVLHVHEIPIHWSELEAEIQIYYPEFTEYTGQSVKEKLTEQLKTIYRDDVDIEYEVRIAPDASIEIAQVVEDKDIDLVVMATHGRSGLKRILLGSVTEKTVRLAPSDILVVRPPEFNTGG